MATEFLTGQRLTADLLNTLVGPTLNPCICMLTQQTAQTGWASSSVNAITFGAGSEIIDSDTLHDTGTNTSRIIIGKRLGWWEVSGIYCPASNSASNSVRSMIAKNGTTIDGSFGGQVPAAVAGFIGVATASILVEATLSTDYIELQGFQTASSGTLGTAINTYVRSSLTAKWVRASL